MIIDGYKIGSDNPPYIVAEISCNHNGSLDKALKLIDVAKECGANAVKFQCYTADTITLDFNSPDFVMKKGPWKGQHLYDLYRKTQTPFEWFPALFKQARHTGITPISSVFDRTSVDLLESLGCPAYKIASMEITDTPLIQYVAKTGKPIIISTGMATEEEINDAYHATSGRNLIGLACVSNYPTSIEDMHPLRKIGYGVINGLSDHTPGWDVAVAATTLGAQIIEKHLMLFRQEYDKKPEDADFSLDPYVFKIMCNAVRSIWKAIQPSFKQATSEEASRQARRSLYVVKAIKKGEIFTESNIRSIRPAYGLPPKELYSVLGKRAMQDVDFGTAMSWSLVDQTS